MIVLDCKNESICEIHWKSQYCLVANSHLAVRPRQRLCPPPKNRFSQAKGNEKYFGQPKRIFRFRLILRRSLLRVVLLASFFFDSRAHTNIFADFTYRAVIQLNILRCLPRIVYIYLRSFLPGIFCLSCGHVDSTNVRRISSMQAYRHDRKQPRKKIDNNCIVFYVEHSISLQHPKLFQW